MSLAMPIGLILSGFFADRIGVDHRFFLSGSLIIGISMISTLLPEFRKRTRDKLSHTMTVHLILLEQHMEQFREDFPDTSSRHRGYEPVP